MSEGFKIVGEAKVLPVDCIHKNPWNPNRMDDDEYEAVRNALALKGQVAPIVVRSHPEIDGHYQIIDGEHRHRAAQELGAKEIAVYDLGGMSEADAMHLNVVLTETRGASDAYDLGSLINVLKENGVGVADLAMTVPQSAERLAELMEIAQYDWKKTVEDEGEKAAQSIKGRVTFGPFELPQALADDVAEALDLACREPGCERPELAFYRAVTGQPPPVDEGKSD